MSSDTLSSLSLTLVLQTDALVQTSGPMQVPVQSMGLHTGTNSHSLVHLISGADFSVSFSIINVIICILCMSNCNSTLYVYTHTVIVHIYSHVSKAPIRKVLWDRSLAGVKHHNSVKANSEMTIYTHWRAAFLCPTV